jgi:hypothetical protein
MFLLPTVFFLAFISWAYALYSAVKLAGHRKPDVPLSKLIMSGFAWFNKHNFTEDGEQHRKAFLTAFVAFFVCVIVLMVIVMTQAPSITPQYQFKAQ